MKTLFVLGLVFISTSIFAQNKSNTTFKSLYELLKSKPIPGKIEFKFPMAGDKSEPVIKMPESRIVSLALDNMPCLVPSVKEFNMPVLRLSPSGTMLVR